MRPNYRGTCPVCGVYTHSAEIKPLPDPITPVTYHHYAGQMTASRRADLQKPRLWVHARCYRKGMEAWREQHGRQLPEWALEAARIREQVARA